MPQTFKGSSALQEDLRTAPSTRQDDSLQLSNPSNRSTSAPRRSWSFRRAVAKSHEVKPMLLPAKQVTPVEVQKAKATINDGGWRAFEALVEIVC